MLEMCSEQSIWMKSLGLEVGIVWASAHAALPV